MKKFLAFLLVLMMVFALVACGNDETSKDESSTPAAESGASAEDSSETPSEESSQEPSQEPSTEPSTEPSEDPVESSEVEPDESSEVEPDESSEVAPDESSNDDPGTDPAEVVFTNKYISWSGSIGTGIVGLRISDATSLALSKVNEAVVAGDVGLFTSAFGKNIKTAGQDYSDFAIAVFEYNHDIFGYKLTSFADVGKGNASTRIPSDGYVLAIYKDQEAKIAAIKAVDADTQVFYPHGVTVNTGLNTTIKKGTATVDGNITAKEYGGKVVWDIKPNNTLVSYEQFQENNYYATAQVYMTYDDEYLYLGVIVDSPYHYLPLTAATASSMWSYECIQVNTCALPNSSEYISEHWDNVVDGTAVNDGVVRQYGFGVNDDGETIQCLWMGDTLLESPTTVCVRDDDKGLTYYEAAIPFSSIGKGDYAVTGTKGTQIGVSVSINSTNQDDYGSRWKNIILRDGGGIIGLNDWSKVPAITLG